MNLIPAFAQSDCGGLTLQIASTAALLRTSGALWLASARTLVVADLHFEKGSYFAMRGQMLPPYDTAETLTRLEREVETLNPAMIVCLGDSFHDTAGETRLGSDETARIAALARGRTLIWITGNHDAAAEFSLAGDITAALALADLILRHEPQAGEQPGEVAGHLHPCAKIKARGGSLRRRCFLTDGRRIVLPAFGAYTGGLNVMDEAFAPLIGSGYPLAVALGRDRVYAVDWGSLRGD